jgi:hypothetical protein
MIFALFLLAPTVPSAPSPKNIACSSPSGRGALNSGSQARLERLTSSLTPTTKWRRGFSAARSSKTALAIPGVNSLEESP